MSLSKSTYLLLSFDTLASFKDRSASATTLINPSSSISPNCVARAAAPTYARKNTKGLPLINFGGGITIPDDGYDEGGSDVTTCRNTAFTNSGYSRSIVSPAS